MYILNYKNREIIRNKKFVLYYKYIEKKWEIWISNLMVVRRAIVVRTGGDDGEWDPRDVMVRVRGTSATKQRWGWLGKVVRRDSSDGTTHMIEQWWWVVRVLLSRLGVL